MRHHLFAGTLLVVVLSGGDAAEAQPGPSRVGTPGQYVPIPGASSPMAPPERPDPGPPAPLTGSSGRPTVLLTGYWPPTNEMLRRFSPSPAQNPMGWIGGDWEGRGYDVYSFFPEFMPPNCGNCGKGVGDLEVDYQDTSADFWAIADSIQPVAIITFSRGFIDMSWEVEMNQYNRSLWVNDYVAPFQPTPVPPDASVPAGTLRVTKLPADDIVTAINGSGLGLNSFICFAGDGGGFLSEFIAYHGVWYQSLHDDPEDPAWCVTAGHVHVGGLIPWATATQAAEITVRTVLDYVDSILVEPDASIVRSGVGAVNAGCGDVRDVLFVNGSAGGLDRTYSVGLDGPISVRLDEAPSRKGDGRDSKLCLYAWLQAPGPADEVMLGGGYGPMCFGPFSIATLPAFRTWNSIGRPATLGADNAPGPAPRIPDGGSVELVSLPGGLGQPITITFQGIVQDACSQGILDFSITNGIILNVTN